MQVLFVSRNETSITYLSENIKDGVDHNPGRVSFAGKTFAVHLA